VTRAGQPVRAGDAPDLAGLLTAAALCNDAALRPPAGEQPDWTAVGDPAPSRSSAPHAR
jgi:Ca2+-transporting ATPase